MDAAKETAADENATQTEVNNALNALNAAADKLVKDAAPNPNPQPEQPVQPQPEQPVQPQPEQPRSDKTTPQTGDQTTAALLLVCAVLSGAGMFLVYRKRSIGC